MKRHVAAAAVFVSALALNSHPLAAQDARVAALSDEELAKENAMLRGRIHRLELEKQNAELRERVHRLEADNKVAAAPARDKAATPARIKSADRQTNDAAPVVSPSAADTYASMPVKAPAAMASPWNGFYVGANVGGGWGNNGFGITPNDTGTAGLADVRGLPPAASFKTAGALGGLQLGYNRQVGSNWLIGAEADIDWSGVKGSAASVIPFGTVSTTHTAEERIKWFGTARARLGYLPAPHLLGYVTGGLAYGAVEHSGNYVNNNPNAIILGGPFTEVCSSGATCFAGSSTKVTAGWTLGGGFEYVLAQNWTLKADYLYVSLGRTSVTETALNPTAGSAPATYDANFGRTNFNVGRVGLNYHL